MKILRTQNNDGPLPLFFRKSILAKLLSLIYRSIVRLRNSRFDSGKKIETFMQPVISIGGLRAGGTGKTPMTLVVAKYLQSRSHTIAILSRGYRRKSKKDIIITPSESVDWAAIGDEPAMMHSQIPQAWMGIGAKRVKCARLLQKSIPSNTVFLLDDGFQHRYMKRNLDIVCLDESILSDKLIPCGFLREPKESLARAHIAVLLGSEEKLDALHDSQNVLSEKFPQVDFFIALQKIDCWVEASTGNTSATLPLKSPLALCGIARPERFFNLLESQSICPSARLIFPDHHIYTEYDIKTLRKLYSSGLVTTEKDAVRLLNQRVAIETNFWYLKIKLVFETNSSLNRFNRALDNALSDFKRRSLV